MMMNIEVAFQHLIEIESLNPPTDCHSHAVAQEVDRMVVFEKTCVLREHRALVGFLNIQLQSD